MTVGELKSTTVSDHSAKRRKRKEKENKRETPCRGDGHRSSTAIVIVDACRDRVYLTTVDCFSSETSRGENGSFLCGFGFCCVHGAFFENHVDKNKEGDLRTLYLRWC